MALPKQPFAAAGTHTLVVLLHAFRHTPDRLRWVKQAVGEFEPGAHVVVPPLPLHFGSTADLNQVADDVVRLIDAQVDHRAGLGGDGFTRIILVGHSTGSMIARKAYVIAYGETKWAPFAHRDEPGAVAPPPRRPWADRVTRIVQLAGMNGGWSVSQHMGLGRALQFSLGSVAGHLVLALTRREFAIFQIRRGATFLSSLRLQWLAMQKDAEEQRQQGQPRTTAVVVQILGTVDDLVSPDDNVDLVTGRDFLYMDAPASGHVNVIDMDSSPAGTVRRAVFKTALLDSPDEIRRVSVQPSDQDALIGPNPAGITDVVFVIHGIRDAGFWTHKIARRVQAEGRRSAPQRTYATETSTYGYFPMLSFLWPWSRRSKVAWLMDQYVRAKSSYPDARFSYVGHSNGTYLLASALNDNPACRFERVVFAGSVVRKDYDWARAVRRGQVEGVLNYVATGDWIVASFPGALERVRVDLGSAGHNGFEQARQPPPGVDLVEVRYVEGGHGAALSEQHWDDIARFVCSGTAPTPQTVQDQAGLATFLGRHPWTAWLTIVVVLTLIAVWLWQIPSEGLRALALVALAWLVVKALTRL